MAQGRQTGRRAAPLMSAEARELERAAEVRAALRARTAALYAAYEARESLGDDNAALTAARARVGYARVAMSPMGLRRLLNAAIAEKDAARAAHDGPAETTADVLIYNVSEWLGL